MSPLAVPDTGWEDLIGGLALMVISRSQDILAVEVGSQIPVLAGAVLLLSGWGALRVLAFPLVFLAFSVPPPGFIIDALTVPLKAQISNWVAEGLYRAGYPIAQNGVMIMIGPYQLMVEDACAGLNSIFALSAIGILYVYMAGHFPRPQYHSALCGDPNRRSCQRYPRRTRSCSSLTMVELTPSRAHFTRRLASRCSPSHLFCSSARRPNWRCDRLVPHRKACVRKDAKPFAGTKFPL